MAKEIYNLKEELNSLKLEAAIHQKIDCSDEENRKYREMTKKGLPLPDGVYAYTDIEEDGEDVYYTIYTSNELSESEMLQYIMLKQLHQTKTIKNCLLFFVGLTCLSLVLGIVAGINLANIWSSIL